MYGVAEQRVPEMVLFPQCVSTKFAGRQQARLTSSCSGCQLVQTESASQHVAACNCCTFYSSQPVLLLQRLLLMMPWNG